MEIKNPVLVYSKKAVGENWKTFCNINHMLYKSGFEHSAVPIDDFGYKNLEFVDLVLALGGDGTFLQASHHLKDEKILGINSDSKTSEGALMKLDETNIGELERILDGQYGVCEKTRVAAYLNGKLLNCNALNEISFAAYAGADPSRYEIISGESREVHRSSGVLIATSEGSNARYKSNEGTPFVEKDRLKYLVMAPKRGRLFQPKLLNEYVEEDISFVSDMYNRAVVTFDSNMVFEVEHGDEVRVKVSDKPLKTLEVLK